MFPQVTCLTLQTFSAKGAQAVGLALAIVLPIGCSGTQVITKPLSEPTTAGSAYLGPLANAAVAAYPLAADGTVAAVATATATTNGTGAFSLPQRPYVLQVSGGSYTEESTGGTDSFTGSALRVAYQTAPQSVIVSPYSEAIAETAEASGGLTTANLAAATVSISAFLDGVDPTQTTPTYAPAGQAAPVITPGNRMAFALGAESELRTENGVDTATSIKDIVAQAANGDTIDSCNAGAGNPQPDGTVLAPQGDTCALNIAAQHYAQSPMNISGITSVESYLPSQAESNVNTSATPDACTDRVALLQQNISSFQQLASQRQALLPETGLTQQNWATAKTVSPWGPSKVAYASASIPPACSDVALYQQELVIAVENFWIDHGINYCHHHIPGWLPPNTPSFRDSDSGSTSGGASNGMTCTAQRGADGSQKLPNQTGFATTDTNWQGVDCSNFTAWVYDFAGLTGNQMSGAIGQQACSVSGRQPGVLLNINSSNLAQMVQYLRPGDLLMISQSSPQKGNAYSGDYQVSHVITWTGKHWSDLQSGADKGLYDLTKLGQAGSRLGGDFWDHNVTQSDLASPDTWMIIDSHYAGPAYRPFNTTKGWYGTHVVAVRRIIQSSDAELDPALLPYKLTGSYDASTEVTTITSNQGGGTIFYDTSNGYSCYRSAN